MGNFFIKIHALIDSLASASDLVGHRDKIDFVEDGLGPEFQLFVSSIHSQARMFLEEFIHLVIREDSFLCRQYIFPQC